MTRKQKKQLHNIVQTTMKIVGCSLLFLGMSMGLGISTNVHMEIIAYIMLFLGTIIMIIHSFRGNDHMFLLVSSAGFLLVSNAFLDTPTAYAIAEIYGIALTEDEGWFAQYGKLFIEILKAVA